MARVVGEVAIDVTADIAPLVKQMKNGEGAMDGLRGAAAQAARGLDRFGDQAERLGKAMSVVTAAMGAAVAAGFGLAKGTADSAKEIVNLSRIANTSTDEFQRMAEASKTVGIEQDKLADILKDVNDRVGNFNATGGGPMADFFENIAPKVGITADAFRDLSGPQALQLYVDSLQKAGLNQQDMTFYLEAMASDATALIPLLANNGAEMRRLGDAAAEAGSVMDSTAIKKSEEFNAALGTLMQSFAGLKNRFGETLIPMFTEMMNRINQDVIPVLSSVVTKLDDWMEAFRALDPAVQDAVTVIATAFAAGGLIALALGATIKLLAGVLAYMGPAGLIGAAVVAGIAVWTQYGDEITAVLDGLVAKLDTFKQKALEAIGLGDRLGNINSGMMQGNLMGGGGGIGGMIGGLAGGIAGALSGPDAQQGAGMGAEIGNGLLSGLDQSITDNDQAIRDVINRVPAIAREELGIQSPSRVFAEIGQFLGLGMAEGIGSTVGLVASSVKSLGDGAVGAAENMSSRVLGVLGSMFQGSKKIGAAQALVNAWVGASKALELPFPENILAFGKTLATGLNAVRNIKGATIGGGGASSGATAAGASAPPPTPTANITWNGALNPESLMSLTERLNAEFRQGYQLNLTFGR